MESMYSIKMRASRDEEGKNLHISGAEKLIPEERLQESCLQLLQRALEHSKGKPDQINLKIEKINPEDIQTLDALPVATRHVDNEHQGIQLMKEYLHDAGINNPEQILQYLEETYTMRGAMLLNIDTMERMEPRHDRGIRATYMDVWEEDDSRREKNHFKEALVLATKVVNHPNILGEICISDDPDYITGYFASRKTGYVRITKLKPMGSPLGGRIFLFRGSKEDAANCIEYMEHQKILVRLGNARKE